MYTSEQHWADGATRNCVWLFQTRQAGHEMGEEDHEPNWHTETVFLTRREANAFGERRPYVYGKKGQGWRIFGVVCDGLMADLLGQHATEFEQEVEYIGSH
jgi:hypothetical protein